MWTRYRKWKLALAFPLALLGLFLMSGEPEQSPRWFAGMGLAIWLAVVYLAEEVVWITQNRGRPCEQCGRSLQPRPFRLRIRCPHCGHRD